MMGAVLDTAIALLLVFFLYSLLGSTIQELIAGIWNSRGRFLQSAVVRMLDDASLRIPRLSDFDNRDWRSVVEWIGALCNAIGPKLRRDLNDRTLAGRVLRHGSIAALFKGGRFPSYVPAEKFADALIDVLRTAASDPAPTVDGLRFAIDRLRPGSARTALSTFLTTSADVPQFRQAVISWYAATMDRVTGWYVRHVKTMLLLIGLTLAIGSNTDALYLAKALSQNETMREALVSYASAKDLSPDVQSDAKTQVSTIVKTIGDLDIPIGWPACNLRATKAGALCDAAAPIDGGLWPSAIGGWLLMALAISLGAPFWFDLLQTLVQFRAAGAKPPDQSSDATSVATTTTTDDASLVGSAPGAGATPVNMSVFEASMLSPHDIRLIQSRLGSAQTGQLDDVTRDAVKLYQRKMCMPADGRVTEGLANRVLSRIAA